MRARSLRDVRYSGLVVAAFLACSSAACVLVDATMPPPAAAQQLEVDDGYFYANLAPDGEWFYQAEFGWVWHPTRVDAGWRPYTDGQWVWADDAGWVWDTQEDWGWATYHYGRWYFDPIHAWSWVPGRTWAPAWVSWRVENGYVGWAPMWPAYFDVHPEYRWDRWQHDGDWNRRHDGRDWDRWVFTRDRDFTSDHVGRFALRDRRDRDRVYGSSRDVTQWDGQHPERLGRGIDRRNIERATGRPVRSVVLEPSDKPSRGRNDGGGDSGRLPVFRPRVQESRGKTPDRMGFAKEPTKDQRETDTIRQEKKRIDAVPERDKRRGNDAGQGRGQDGAQGRDQGRGQSGREPDGAQGRGQGRAQGREPKRAQDDSRQQRAPQAQPDARPERVQPEARPERVQPQARPERVQPERRPMEQAPEARPSREGASPNDGGNGRRQPEAQPRDANPSHAPKPPHGQKPADGQPDGDPNDPSRPGGR